MSVEELSQKLEDLTAELNSVRTAKNEAEEQAFTAEAKARAAAEELQQAQREVDLQISQVKKTLCEPMSVNWQCMKSFVEHWPIDSTTRRR